MKAYIKKVSKGKQKGRYRFVLKAGNGEVVGTSGTQSYSSKQGCKQTLIDCFGQYEIIDTTKETE
jgi:uncharacterized protein YegP (UPF0339 family)